ncbi:hypothetical protein ACFTWN_31480 [Streptomyces sp. NPDC057092]|uniref:hypothetical protein n=1 Tax=Streptomyces sp. NPDC057092 TaxID=3346017 RepID=UPI003638CCE2
MAGSGAGGSSYVDPNRVTGTRLLSGDRTQAPAENDLFWRASDEPVRGGIGEGADTTEPAVPTDARGRAAPGGHRQGTHVHGPRRGRRRLDGLHREDEEVVLRHAHELTPTVPDLLLAQMSPYFAEHTQEYADKGEDGAE